MGYHPDDDKVQVGMWVVIIAILFIIGYIASFLGCGLGQNWVPMN